MYTRPEDIIVVGYRGIDYNGEERECSICLNCAKDPEIAIFRVHIARPIFDPAPRGVYIGREVDAEYYDTNCEICGCSIRRE